MYDYSIHLQTKQRIEDMRRENQHRHWLRDLINGRKGERAARKDVQVPNTAHSQYE
jgi:hypothetical protein